MLKFFARLLKWILIVFVLGIVALGAAWLYFGYSPIPPEPTLGATVESAIFEWQGMERTYTRYVPPQLPDNAPLLVVLHGSVMNGAQMRITTGYEFDQLADRKGFVVLYPDGFKGHWNDCRRLPRFSAKKQQIDDMGYLRALIGQMQQRYHIDPHRIFVAGFSNGGHMAFRMRAEAPELVAGIAVAAASPSVAEDATCAPQDDHSPVMMVNGTDDWLNAYAGGERLLPGIAQRGKVLASVEAARLFARHNGIYTEPVTDNLPDRDLDEDTSVQQLTWLLHGKPNVVLYTVEGGGHVIPQPEYRFPRMYGRTTGDLNFPVAVVDFFGL